MTPSNFLALASLSVVSFAGNAIVINDLADNNLDTADRVGVTVIEPCHRIVFTSWADDDLPDCDMDGSQTWVLSDEDSDLDLDRDLTGYCNSIGGIHSISPTDPPTHYCLNVDY
jgi:hypothetical protein